MNKQKKPTHEFCLASNYILNKTFPRIQVPLELQLTTNSKVWGERKGKGGIKKEYIKSENGFK